MSKFKSTALGLIVMALVVYIHNLEYQEYCQTHQCTQMEQSE